jgi:hypothetical protein
VVRAEPGQSGSPTGEVYELGELSPEVVAAITTNPSARHRLFAHAVIRGRLDSKLFAFLDSFRPPIDVRADKILDLSKFGAPLAAFTKAPRVKKKEEFTDDLDDRMKTDLERQFILRNLARFVKTVNKDDPLEFKKTSIEFAKMDVDARAHLQDLHKKPDLLTELGADHARHELAWRHKFLEVMQWERYFCREIREDFSGPLWKHDPDTNPVKTKQADAALKAAE